MYLTLNKQPSPSDRPTAVHWAVSWHLPHGVPITVPPLFTINVFSLWLCAGQLRKKCSFCVAALDPSHTSTISELATTFPCSSPLGCGMLIGIWPSHCRNTKCVPKPQSCYCTRLQMLTDKVSIFWGKTDRSFTHLSISLGFTTLREQLMGL